MRIECPACLGSGGRVDDDGFISAEIECPVCDGAGECDPQRVVEEQELINFLDSKWPIP